MAPKNRGGNTNASTKKSAPIPPGFHSKSTPNLPTLRSFSAHEPDGSPDTKEAIPPQQPQAPTHFSNLAPPIFLDSQDPHLPTSPSSDSSPSPPSSPATRPLYTSRSTTALPLPPRPSANLFPPFYNRPPVPLPPSPSLTSLLRPSFSNNASHPSTPESSDMELPPAQRGTTNPARSSTTSPSAQGTSIGTGAGTGTSTPTLSTLRLSTLRDSARPIPRATPRVPTYEYYGFALYISSSLLFLLYILWAYVPSPLLHQMGIHYYPNRWWALAVPSWLAVLVVWIYVALGSYNTGYLTLPLKGVGCLVDERGSVAVVDRRTGEIVKKVGDVGEGGGRRGEGTGAGGKKARNRSLSDYQFEEGEEVDWKSLWSTGTDAVLDVPIGGVCEILYGAGREDDD